METFPNHCIPFEITILVIGSARIWLNMLIAWILTFFSLSSVGRWTVKKRLDADVEIDQYSEYFTETWDMKQVRYPTSRAEDSDGDSVQFRRNLTQPTTGLTCKKSDVMQTSTILPQHTISGIIKLTHKIFYFQDGCFVMVMGILCLNCSQSKSDLVS